MMDYFVILYMYLYDFVGLVRVVQLDLFRLSLNPTSNMPDLRSTSIQSSIPIIQKHSYNIVYKL